MINFNISIATVTPQDFALESLEKYSWTESIKMNENSLKILESNAIYCADCIYVFKLE